MVALAQYFLEKHRPNPTDYVERFREMLLAQPEPEPAAKPINEPKAEILCPKCGSPMVLRKAAKGPNAGKEFYGCSRFPQCRGIVNVK